PAAKNVFRSDATYLISGGLGGFGFATAQWIADEGGRNLALVSRRATLSRGDEARIAALRERGVCVEVLQADVSKNDEVAAVVAQIQDTMPPLRGIFHAAMVLDDGFLLQLNANRYERVFQPKIAGGWNLHLATRELKLDHFVLFSSGASWYGQPGQANYSAANSFL